MGPEEKASSLLNIATFSKTNDFMGRTAMLNILTVLLSTWLGTHLPKYLFSRQPPYWVCSRMLYTRHFVTQNGERQLYSRPGVFLIMIFTAPPRALINQCSFLLKCAITRHIMTADREGSSLDPWQVSVLLWHGFCSLVNFFLIFLILLAWVGNVSHRSWFRHVVTWLCYIWGDHEAFGTVV